MDHLKQTAIILLFVFSMTSGDLDAQIRDDEESTNYLAVQCAMSSGGDAGSFEEYGRRLAKTVALLSPGQQKRVFGFVPQPITFAIPAASSQSHSGFAGGAGSATEPETAAAGEAGSVVGNTEPSSGDSTPVSATSAPEPEVGNSTLATPVAVEEAGTEEAAPGNDWWGGFVEWLDGLFKSIVSDIAKQQQADK